jgi:hypothetical protein
VRCGRRVERSSRRSKRRRSRSTIALRAQLTRGLSDALRRPQRAGRNLGAVLDLAAHRFLSRRLLQHRSPRTRGCTSFARRSRASSSNSRGHRATTSSRRRLSTDFPG